MENKLTSLYIYLTDNCNLQCIHCFQDAPLEGGERYSLLSFKKCQDFLNDALSLGLKNVTFSGGEPLLNKEISHFASYFSRNNVHMSMETNGTLIKDNIDLIRSNQIYCCIGLDGLNADTHNKQRANKDAYAKTMEGIKVLESEKLNYQLIMSISKSNYHELFPLMNYVKDNFNYCGKFKINIVIDQGRAKNMSKRNLLFQVEEFPEIVEKVGKEVSKYPFQVLLHLDPAFFPFKNFSLQYFCGGSCGYQKSLSILANGQVSICSLGKQVENFSFGSVSEIDLVDIWSNHPTLTNIHESTYKKLKGICSNCIFRTSCFGGCRARAIQSYGEVFAPHPQCQRYYELGLFPKSKMINPNNDCSYLSTNNGIEVN